MLLPIAGEFVSISVHSWFFKCIVTASDGKMRFNHGWTRIYTDEHLLSASGLCDQFPNQIELR